MVLSKMTKAEEVQAKIRLIKREWRGDSKMELIFSLLSLMADRIESQQRELDTLRARLAFAGHKKSRG
jgi:hypothetical protein